VGSAVFRDHGEGGDRDPASQLAFWKYFRTSTPKALPARDGIRDHKKTHEGHTRGIALFPRM